MKRIVTLLLLLLLALMVLVSCKSDDIYEHGSTETKATTQMSETSTEVPAKETEAPTEKPTQAKKDESWKKLYINQLNVLNKDEFSEFSLIYVDGDDVPELYVNGKSRFEDGHLYWVYNGQLCEYAISVNGFSYVEYGNVFLNVGGFQGHCFEEVLSIKHDATMLLAQGDYLDPMIAGYESYKWNNSEVSESEYMSKKNAVFDENKAITCGIDSYYSYSDICQQITQW